MTLPSSKSTQKASKNITADQKVSNGLDNRRPSSSYSSPTKSCSFEQRWIETYPLIFQKPTRVVCHHQNRFVHIYSIIDLPYSRHPSFRTSSIDIINHIMIRRPSDHRRIKENGLLDPISTFPSYSATKSNIIGGSNKFHFNIGCHSGDISSKNDPKVRGRG